MLMFVLSACSNEESVSEVSRSLSESSQSSARSELLPGGIDPADYDNVINYGSFHILSNETGKTRPAVAIENMRPVLSEVPDTEVWFLSADGEIANTEPYQYYEMLFTHVVGFRDGSFDSYEITENGLVFHNSASPESKEFFGYTVTSYHWYVSTPCYGVTAPDGSIFAEPIYEIVKIPFPERILLFEGSIQSRHFTRCNILDSEGNVLNDSFNYVEYSVFDGGYIGIAFCGSEKIEPEHFQTFDPEGNPMPFGYWFVDMDGNIISERYETLFVNEEWNYSSVSEDDTIYAVTSSGEELTFRVGDILIKH